MEPIAHPPPGWRAFEEIYRTCYPAVHGYVSRRLSRSDVDDVVAEVFTTAWRRFDDLPGVPLPWLYRVAANHLAHQYRTDGRRARLAMVGVAAADDEFDAVCGRLDDGALVRTALGLLSEADVEVLRLWAWEQLEPAQIAVVLDCSAPAARVRLHRAKRRLRAALPDPGPEPAPAPRPSLITDSRY